MKAINLERLQAKFVALIEKYMKENNLDQGDLAERVGIQASHMNSLLRGKRNLTAYYLGLFFGKGVLNVSQIYDNSPATERERQWWDAQSFLERQHHAVRRLMRLEEKGVDINKLLDSLAPEGVENKNKD